jgi:hypothetical protein
MPAKPSSQQPVQHSFPTLKCPCQICGKLSHKALGCFHHVDYLYQGRHPLVQLIAMVAQTNSSQGDDTWFSDNGVNQHITSNLEQLTL